MTLIHILSPRLLETQVLWKSQSPKKRKQEQKRVFRGFNLFLFRVSIVEVHNSSFEGTIVNIERTTGYLQ